MFSSTHLRSSSWKQNTELQAAVQSLKTNWHIERDATKCWTYFFAQQFLGAVRIRLWAPHLHPLYRANHNCDTIVNISNVTAGKRVLPKASFSMGSLASSSSSSSIRGEWENLRNWNQHWNFDLKYLKKKKIRIPVWHWPLAVGRRPQQDHDHQQNGGEEQTPEGIVHPQVPPPLRGESVSVIAVQIKKNSHRQTASQQEWPSDSPPAWRLWWSRWWKWWKLRTQQWTSIRHEDVRHKQTGSSDGGNARPPSANPCPEPLAAPFGK